MSGRITGIDHLVVGVQDLDTAAATWRRLGFTLTPRGRHRDMATGNYCIMFPVDYLELIGIVEPGLPDRGFGARLAEGGEGLDRCAFATDDPVALADRLRESGIAAKGPAELRRPVKTPDGGEADAIFRLVMLPDGAAPGINGFVCYHDTPELVRRPEWLRHENTALSIRSMTAVVERPEDHVAAWEALLGPGSTVLTDDVVAAHAGSTPVMLVSPDHLATMYPAAAADPDPAVPSMAVMSIAVEDTDRTAAVLGHNDVAFTRDPAGNVHVPPTESHGVRLVFER
ncbi:MAG: VOC family protein [Pseudomonadota bacterium]|nr:VOC family protein [Pseudomonadota bacterium]